jgi:hypothetical protein
MVNPHPSGRRVRDAPSGWALSVRRAAFTVHRSPFTVRRSPFTGHRSAFGVWHAADDWGRVRRNAPIISFYLGSLDPTDN